MPLAAESRAPDVGAYDPHAATSMAAQAQRSTGRKSMGTFGATARDLDFGQKASSRDTPRDGPTSAETAAVPSTFGSGSARASARSRGPSAAMGGGSRFAPAREATGGDYYVPPALGQSKSYNGNRRTSLCGTMGSTKRFTEVKVSAPGDYSGAKPGAFASSAKKNGAQNTGFGGTSSRVSAFAAAAKAAEENASSHLTYDGAYNGTGAFAKANQATNRPSGSFASKSSQRAAVSAPEGPGAAKYNTAAVGSLASGANHSFNKSHQRGTGGFGTSARRSSEMSARDADVPGPGEYAPDISDAAPAARPSSAFASTTRKGETHVRQIDSTNLDYDAHTTDGMAATATKTFNKKAAGGTFGLGSKRQTHETKDTPGPGEYTQADPVRPTVDSGLKASKGRGTGAFASTTLRDSGQWSGFKSFLP